MKKIKKSIIVTCIIALAVTIPTLVYATQSKPWIHPYVSQEEYEKLPLEKKTQIDKEIIDKENARSGKIKQADKNKAYTPDINLQSQFDQGIQDKEAPPGVHDILTENIWRGIVENTFVSLYAGKKAGEDTQGVIFVDITDKNHKNIVFKEILTPTKDGAVKVAKENGNQIILTSEKGNTFTFDLKDLAFK